MTAKACKSSICRSWKAQNLQLGLERTCLSLQTMLHIHVCIYLCTAQEIAVRCGFGYRLSRACPVSMHHAFVKAHKQAERVVVAVICIQI